MDTETFVKKLNKVFCDSHKTSGKYSEVWLTEANLGGLYRNGKYVLNVKMEEHIESCFDEIGKVLELLEKEANEQSKLIWSVIIYNHLDYIECEEGIQVFTEEEACA